MSCEHTHVRLVAGGMWSRAAKRFRCRLSHPHLPTHTSRVVRLHAVKPRQNPTGATHKSSRSGGKIERRALLIGGLVGSTAIAPVCMASQNDGEASLFASAYAAVGRWLVNHPAPQWMVDNPVKRW
eukprot:9471013-Pyramimonas_sp.AAC.1